MNESDHRIARLRSTFARAGARKRVSIGGAAMTNLAAIAPLPLRPVGVIYSLVELAVRFPIG
jgi:hypothetical protein